MTDSCSEVKNGDVVTHGHHEVDVVFDEQNCHSPFLGEPGDERRQLSSFEIVQASGRLIKKQDTRLSRNGTSNG